MSKRNWKDRRYIAWRKSVRCRDDYTCQMPDCGIKKKLEVHHIQPYIDFPELRLAVDNGITLCYGCHNSIRGKEEEYAPLFKSIVDSKKKGFFDVFLEMLKMRHEAGQS